jgi:chemotaxis methyl-accepting protein methylase
MDYAITTDEFERFRTLIYDKSGISLSDQKRTLVASRLSKRLRELGLATVFEASCVVFGMPRRRSRPAPWTRSCR